MSLERLANMQNPAWYLFGPKSAKIRDAPMPTLQDDDDVIIRIEYVGVCGSDVSRIPSHASLLYESLPLLSLALLPRFTSGNMVASEPRSIRRSHWLSGTKPPGQLYPLEPLYSRCKSATGWPSSQDFRVGGVDTAKRATITSVPT